MAHTHRRFPPAKFPDEVRYLLHQCEQGIGMLGCGFAEADDTEGLEWCDALLARLQRIRELLANHPPLGLDQYQQSDN